MAAAAAIACVTSFGRGDGVRELDEPIDGIDNGDLLAIIYIFSLILLNVCLCKIYFIYFNSLLYFGRTFLYYIYLNSAVMTLCCASFRTQSVVSSVINYSRFGVLCALFALVHFNFEQLTMNTFTPHHHHGLLADIHFINLVILHVR